MHAIKDIHVLVPDENTVIVRTGEKGGQFGFSARLTRAEFRDLYEAVNFDLDQAFASSARGKVAAEKADEGASSEGTPDGV